MNDNMSARGGSASGGKKGITIAIVIILALGLGYFLFKISPQEQQQQTANLSDFDLSAAKPGSQTEPRPLESDDHIFGNPNAKNTLITYEDYQCPYCAQASGMLGQAPSQLQDTKVVFRYFPLSIHRNSVVSAYAA